jgi:fatty-acid peroxygenase
MIPALRAPDSTLQFLGDGYGFISKTADRLGTDAFRTRIGLRPVLCLRGGEAARFFARDGHFGEVRAMPPSFVRLLQDRGRGPAPEADEVLRRRAGFAELMHGSSESRMAGIAEDIFSSALLEWRGEGTVRMRDELPRLFTGIALRFAGVPQHRMERDARAGELWAMVESAGSFGPAAWAASARRTQTEQWARGLIRDVREGRERAVIGTPLAAVANWRGDDGELPLEVAAVELLNLLRPTVAVALFAEFATLALIQKPRLRKAFANGDLTMLDGFVHEVRRRTPFFPVIAGRATADLDWQGDTVRAGTWTMLDLYGTNHDARLWPHPMSFDPGRYARGEGDAAQIVIQGSGAFAFDRPGLGEPATEALLRNFTVLLARLRWAVPAQDLRVRYDRMPAEIRDGLRLHFA